MATDVRKHTVPAPGDAPRRQAILDLGLSIRDVIPVANTTARSQLITAMGAAGQGPSASNPVLVFRADATAGLNHEYTTDGTTWRVLRAVDTGWVDISSGLASGFTGAVQVRNLNDMITVRCSNVVGAFPEKSTSTTFLTIPTEYTPATNLLGAAYVNSPMNPATILMRGLGGASIIHAMVGGATSAAFTITYPRG